MGCPNLVQMQTSSHGYILKAHMNKRKLLNSVMFCINVNGKILEVSIEGFEYCMIFM